MKFLRKTTVRFYIVYENDVDSMIPEKWANESLAILMENMVLGSIIHRDFSNEIAEFGDTVNTRKPAEMTSSRKSVGDDIVTQDVSAPNIPVVLNQHIYNSFIIRDSQMSMAFKDLVTFFLDPAMKAQARILDRIIAAQVHRFRRYSAGKLGTAINGDYLVDSRKVLEDNKVPDDSRYMVLTTQAEADLLKDEQFTDASKVGDDGTALRRASLGMKFGWNLLKAQNTPMITSAFATTAGAINNATGYNVGDTVLTVDGTTGIKRTGAWLTIVGEATPYFITAHTETTGNTTSITLDTGLRNAVLDNAVIAFYTPGQVNLVAGYAAGWVKEIVVDGFTIAPQPGQGIVFSSDPNNVYGIVSATTTSILLDRPLVNALVNDDYVGISPLGSYNFGLRKNAIAMVTRPLAMPPEGTGTRSAIVNAAGFGMRAVISYDPVKQGTRVTLDILAGITQLEPLEGMVLFSK